MMTRPSGTPGSVTLMLSGSCGLVMAAAAGAGGSGAAGGVALLAAGAVLLGLWWKMAATTAVLLAVAAIAVTGPPPVWAAAAGLASVGYLVLRHTGTVTVPTAVFALGFTAAGLIAAVFPGRLPWLPLLAPFAALALYVVAAEPFLRAQR